MKKINYESVDAVYSYLVDNEYFTSDELDLVTCINGWKLESLNDCIYCRYGYRDLEQMLTSE